MSPIKFLCRLAVFKFFLAVSISANVCSRSYNASSFNGGSFTGGVQLLIPSWTFNCEGVIDSWFAHANGSISILVGSGIEFQVLKPDPVKSNVYNLVYGNTYGDDVMGTLSASGTRIRIDVNGGYLLPVRVGYIVGVYIDPNAANELSLLYEETEEDIDIYYWENLTERKCDLSLCDAKVMRGVRPLFGWSFRNISSGLSHQEGIIDFIRSVLQYCNSSLPSNCSQLPSISMSYTSIQISQSTSITSKEYFYTMTNSIEGTMSLSNILSHTTLTTMVLASTSLSVSPVVASSSDTTTSVTPTAQSNSSNSDQLIFILAASVAGLLVITIFLLLVMILVFGFKCVRRCNSKRQVKKTAADASTNKPSHHISTGVNPSYHQHSIITTMEPTEIAGMEERFQFEEELHKSNELVDSNKLYEYDDVHVYCQPEPPHVIKSKLHTYGNVGKSNDCGPIYEDTDTL